jgi:predicted PurR-regulated permease PerM
VARSTLIVIGLVVVTALALLLVYETRRVLVWMVIAAFFATALYPAVNWVQRRMPWCKRWLATLLVFLLVLIALGGLVTLFAVPLVKEGAQLADDMPRIVADVRAGRGPIGDLVQRFNLRRYADAERLQGYASVLSARALPIITGAFTTVAGIVTIFVLAYLMVLEAPRIIDGTLALFDERRAERIRKVGADCARTVTGYITGNLLISVICGLLTYVVLLVLGVPYAGLIALFVAIADLIPLVGATLGAVVVAIVTLFTDFPTATIIWAIFSIVYQQLENTLIQPQIQKRAVNVHPFVVLVAVLFGSTLLGVLGALVAIPVAASIQIAIREWWDYRHEKSVAEIAGTPIAPSPPPEPEPA